MTTYPPLRSPSRLSWLHRKVFLFIQSRDKGATAYEVEVEFKLIPATASTIMRRLVKRDLIEDTKESREGRTARRVRIYKEKAKVLSDCDDCGQQLAYRYWGTNAYCGRCIDAAIRMDPELHDCPKCHERQPHNVMWKKTEPCGWCKEMGAE